MQITRLELLFRCLHVQNMDIIFDKAIGFGTNGRREGEILILKISRKQDLFLKTFSVLLFCCVFFGFGQVAVAASEGTEKNVLILHFQDAFSQGVLIEDQNFRSAFKNSSDLKVNLYTEYLNYYSFNSETIQAETLKLLKLKYSDMKLDLVIAVDDAEYKYALLHREELFPNIPIVYTAANMGSQMTTTGNVLATGNYKNLDLEKNVDLIKVLEPDVKNLVVVTGSGKLDANYDRVAKNVLSNYSNQLSVSYTIDMSYSEIKSLLTSLPEHTAVLYIAIYNDGKGDSFNPRDALAELCKLSNAPIYGVSDTYIGTGMVGGSLISYDDLSKDAAQKALRILKGEPADKIPDSIMSNRTYLDGSVLEKWHIDFKRIPNEAVVLNRPIDYWDRKNSKYILIIGLASGIVFTLVFRYCIRRKNEDVQVLKGDNHGENK